MTTLFQSKMRIPCNHWITSITQISNLKLIRTCLTVFTVKFLIEITMSLTLVGFRGCLCPLKLHCRSLFYDSASFGLFFNQTVVGNSPRISHEEKHI